VTARDSSAYSMLTCTVFDLLQFSVSSCTGIGIGIGVGQYYWVLGIGCLVWYRSNPSNRCPK